MFRTVGGGINLDNIWRKQNSFDGSIHDYGLLAKVGVYAKCSNQRFLQGFGFNRVFHSA